MAYEEFCRRFGLKLPILLAPMAGACPPSLSIAVMQAGGLGSCGAVQMKPEDIKAWADEVRPHGPFNLNLWVPDPKPHRDAANEAELRKFLGGWGPEVPADAGDAAPPDFEQQCQALLDAAPPIVSSVMGLFPAGFVAKLKARGIVWVAHVSTVGEAKAAEAAGADVIGAQGMEAGGHRGAFDAKMADRALVGLFSLLPSVVDAVKLPVVATGGIADGRGVAAALALGASAAQIGTAFLRSPEAKLAPSWAEALGRIAPEDAVLTRAFSGRWGRAIATDYVKAMAEPGAPNVAPYPVQRALTANMRAQGLKQNDLARIQAWSGQSSAIGNPGAAGDFTRRVWDEARKILKI